MQQSAAGETNRSSVKKLPAFLEPNVHYHIHNSTPFCLNPVHVSSYYLILYYHLHLGLPSGLFPLGVHTKNLRELLSPIRAICPAYLLTLFAHPINISCRIYSHMSTAVPADEPCYVTHCYQYTSDGYPEQDGCITSVYFQRY